MTENENVPMIKIHIMGKEYKVPIGVTLMEAFEYAGYQIIRGAGCRAGFCGACSTIYRKEGDYRLYTALACQTVAEDGMFLAQLPFVPANRAKHNVKEKDVSTNVLLSLYPSVARCVSCNTCSKACPQDLEVMDYVQAALRGDIEQCAKLSFDCIQCGLCAIRCPAEIPQYHVGMLARRLNGYHYLPPPASLENRINEIEEGKFNDQFEELKTMNLDQLKEKYTSRPKEGVK